MIADADLELGEFTEKMLGLTHLPVGTLIYPKTRHARHVILPDGKIEDHYTTKRNPWFYKSTSDVLQPVEVAVSETENRAGKDVNLYTRNIVSAGFWPDANKMFGFRPENTNGKEQLEITPLNPTFDGHEASLNIGTPSVTKTEALGYMYDFGDVIGAFSKVGFKVLTKPEPDATKFEVPYTINLAGLTPRRVGDEYHFHGAAGAYRFKWATPKLINKQTLEIAENIPIKHSLTLEKKGVYLYKKWVDNGITDLSDYYIDADTYYSTTDDGRVYSDAESVWADAHNATDGAGLSTVEGTSTYCLRCSKIGTKYYIGRSFLPFTTTAATGDATSVSAFIYGYTSPYSGGDVCIHNGTFGVPLAVADYDAFSGSALDNISSWSESSYNEFTGILSLLVPGGTTKVCLRNYTYDYLDSAPPSRYTAGLYFANYTGVDHDPYLSVVEPSPGGRSYAIGVMG